jgi:transcriptional regulator GlxA family with amidase domain
VILREVGLAVRRQLSDDQICTYQPYASLMPSLAMNNLANFPINLSRRRVAILGFHGVAALDLTGPLEALSMARFPGPRRASLPCYRPMILGLGQNSFTSESGLVFKAEACAESADSFDTILIPGGRGLRQPETLRRAADWLAARAESTRRIASISTGLYALAQSGLVDGRPVTTHWRFSRDLAQRFPKLRVNPTALFLKNGRFYTSAGGAAGVEMTIALIEEDHGGQVARAVARELVVRLRPPGESDELFELANFQSDPAERVVDLPGWISAHLHERLTVEALAERVCLCPRHFSRLFKQVFNCTPADFVEELRLSEARRRLLGLRSTVESVAGSVGFKSSDAFRRAFERRVGVTPTAFRRHAGGSADNAPSTKVVGQPPQVARQAHAYPKQIAA